MKTKTLADFGICISVPLNSSYNNLNLWLTQCFDNIFFYFKIWLAFFVAYRQWYRKLNLSLHTNLQTPRQTPIINNNPTLTDPKEFFSKRCVCGTCVNHSSYYEARERVSILTDFSAENWPGFPLDMTLSRVGKWEARNSSFSYDSTSSWRSAVSQLFNY